MGKWFKKVFFISAIITLGITMSITVYAIQDTNLDAPSDWAYEEIIEAKELNLLTDRIQGSYRTSITREEFSELALKLYTILSGVEVTIENETPFDDTQNLEIAAAYKLGIVNGVGNGIFTPYNTATREEVSVILYRTLKAAKPEHSFSEQSEIIFEDKSIISSWAQEAVGNLSEAGVISGVGDNQFNPGGVTSREEAIALIRRMYETFSDNYSKPDVSEYSVVSRGDRRSNGIEKLKVLISQEMGKPYQWGGTGPDCYDCSGLVYSIYGKLGISLPRVSASQATAGTYISKDELKYGDLVFFAKDGKNVHHVGIYTGNGNFVHAPSTGDVVKTSTILSGYYKNTYYTARRVIP